MEPTPQRASSKAMAHPWANTALLALLGLQAATGLGALLVGDPAMDLVPLLHGVGGYALLVLLWFKGAVVIRALQRGRWTVSRALFIGLAAVLGAILGTGLWWTWAGTASIGGMSVMVIHGMLGAGVFAGLAWHVLKKRFLFRHPEARDRRAFLKLAGVTAAGGALRLLAEPVKSAGDLPGAERRFTGSYETGSLTGAFPATSWMFDDPAPLDTSDYTLSVEGAVERPETLTLTTLAPLEAAAPLRATLDCTGGYYTTQDWSGVSLETLIERAGLLEHAASVSVISSTGYARRFPLDALPNLLLATQVAGEPLSHGHGAPLRLVAPGRRGFEWVKWVTTIRVETTGPWWQPPFPLQ